MTQERRPRGRCLFSEGRPRHPNPKTDRLGLMPDSRAHCWRPLADPEASGGGASSEAAAGFVRWLLERAGKNRDADFGVLLGTVAEDFFRRVGLAHVQCGHAEEEPAFVEAQEPGAG